MPEGLTDAQIVERLGRLERNVALVAEAVGVTLEDPATGIDSDIAELARGGRRIEAARLLCERMGAEFIDAQRVVNEL